MKMNRYNYLWLILAIIAVSFGIYKNFKSFDSGVEGVKRQMLVNQALSALVLAEKEKSSTLPAGEAEMISYLTEFRGYQTSLYSAGDRFYIKFERGDRGDKVFWSRPLNLHDFASVAN